MPSSFATTPAGGVAQPRRVVYAVTSDGRDTYAAMARLSIASLRRSNPGCKVVVACDDLSRRALEQAGNLLLQEADEVRSWATPPGDAQFRNRYIKTTLREKITGAFLYLDADTLVRGSLDPVFAVSADVAGALNHSHDDFAHQVWQGDRDTLDALGWSIGPSRYLNSGVIFLKDTPAARALARRWHQNWRETYPRLGHSRDQAAFNAALHEVGPRVAVLPHRFNAQFRTNPLAAKDAAVWHYYASNGSPPTTFMETFAARLAPGEAINQRQLRRMAGRAWPWRWEGWRDARVAGCMREAGIIDRYQLLWRQGRRWESLRKRGWHALQALAGKRGRAPKGGGDGRLASGADSCNVPPFA